MRLLILTQAVDGDDPVLGFFHGWVKEFSTRFERIHVVCLKEGRHALPHNVSVHSLGKERRVSRIRYVWNFYRYVWKLRHEHEAVFVHMNQEYVLLGGIFWRVIGKRVVLWRNHKIGSFSTRISGWLAHTVCYTSPAAYVATYRNAIKMPIGIDTGGFTSHGVHKHGTVLFLGRIDEVKKPDIFLEALAVLEKEGVRVAARIYGDPTPGREAYARALMDRFKGLKSVSLYSGVPNSKTPGIYASHRVYVNLTPSGSFDKTIGEAMAAGCIVVASNDAVRDIVPHMFMANPDSASSVAACIKAALEFGDSDCAALVRLQQDYVERTHSLTLLTDRLFGILAA
jgi:glycosyltransferase involved in cell wall biosynthesis